jgi:hypothetical protein
MDALSTSYNNAIDVLVASGRRFLELPLIMLGPAAVLAFFGILALIWLAGRTRGKHWPSRTFIQYFAIAYGLVACVVIIDRKLNMVLNEVHSLRGLKALVADALRRPVGSAGSGGAAAINREFFFDKDRVKSGLQELFAQDSAKRESVKRPIHVDMVATVNNPAVDYVSIEVGLPHEIRMHVAVIDLRYPGLEVCITPEFGEKIMTTDFARANDCVVAVNGEAGNSPATNSGLGQWKGNWISRGKAVMLEDTDLRPFMSFDMENHGRYFEAKIVDTTVTPEKYNTIWGRFDLLLDGKKIIADTTRTPRTLMGLSSDGSRLILLVADGRQPGYSRGLDLEAGAQIMLLFGAANAMVCDQGGSTCMYLKSTGGLASVPSDSVGERPTYSHIGVKLTK